VPRNQATLQWSYVSIAGVQTRWSSSQFDDDLNEFPLRSYIVTDVFVSRGMFTLTAENIFNRRIEAGATPVLTLGQPRAVRLAFRFRK
jgi:hypothetical protein